MNTRLESVYRASHEKDLRKKIWEKRLMREKTKQINGTWFLEMVSEHMREQFEEFWDKNCTSRDVPKTCAVKNVSFPIWFQRKESLIKGWILWSVWIQLTREIYERNSFISIKMSPTEFQREHWSKIAISLEQVYQTKGRQEIRQRQNNGENNPHRLACWKEQQKSQEAKNYPMGCHTEKGRREKYPSQILNCR